MNPSQQDRASGVLLAQACGDALGVPYEFGPALPDDRVPVMRGGGPFGFAPGEYSDDTAMAACIADVSATGADLTRTEPLDRVAQNFLAWARTAKDVGSQTSAVFALTSRGRSMTEAAREFALTHEHSAGNGALMRTAVVGLTRLDDRDATAAAARAVAELTHADPLATESCVLWSEAVRVAVVEERLDLLDGLDLLPADRRDAWQAWVDEATGVDPRTFDRNGFTVRALQAAWAAITWTPVPADEPARHLQLALENAVRTGHDTDTVAAIAGGLLGARWGQSAVPSRWFRRVHGYGDHHSRDLVRLALLTATGGASDSHGWPACAHMTSPAYRDAPDIGAVHPHDDQVVLGTVATTDHGCDAVVSLCRMGRDDVPAPGVAPDDHLEFRLLDSDDPADNPHLAFVLDDVARSIAAMRDEGKRVLVHCVAAEQRTPTAAMAYSVLLGHSLDEARDAARQALPGLRGHGLLWEAVHR